MDIETSADELVATKPKLMGKVYPNPAQTIIHVPIYANTEASIEISDLTGRSLVNQPVAASENHLSIDISNWSKGVYFVKISTKDAAQIEKFVVR